jgi:uncharacterized protein
VTGFEHLDFACNGCGDCCRRHRVALTHHDLVRLRRAVSEPAERLVEWLAPDKVDPDAESASYVNLPEGPRLMVLAHANGACRFLTSEDRCSAYSARPRDCELYPFVLERDERRRPVRLALFEPAGCGERGATARDIAALDREDARRWAEVEEYRAIIARWNRLERHRRRLGRRANTSEQFLAFLESRVRLDNAT